LKGEPSPENPPLEALRLCGRLGILKLAKTPVICAVA